MATETAKSKENLVFDSKENPVEFYLEKCLDVEKNRRRWTKSFLESRRISLVSFAQKYIFPLVSEALWCLRPNTEIFRKRRGDMLFDEEPMIWTCSTIVSVNYNGLFGKNVSEIFKFTPICQLIESYFEHTIWAGCGGWDLCPILLQSLEIQF